MKPRTAEEYNIFHIKNTLKKLRKRRISIKSCGLNHRLMRLKLENEGMYDELYQEYLGIAKFMSE